MPIGIFQNKSCSQRYDNAKSRVISQIVLHWINNIKSVMKQWVRNRAIEINRLTECKSWKYVNSKDIIANLGTRKGAKVADVCDGTSWINGYPWMKLDEVEFPAKTVYEIKLTNNELSSHRKECLDSESLDNEWINDLSIRDLKNETYTVKSNVPSEVVERYRFFQICN